MNEDIAEYDDQAAAHQDHLLMEQATIERLLEMRLLVNAFPNYTWLNQDDVDGLALASGLYTRFRDSISQLGEKNARAKI